MRRRTFTLDEANALLPWLEARFQELDPGREELEQRQSQYFALLRQSRSNGMTIREVELDEAQRLVDQARSRVGGIFEEIGRAGIIVRDANMGLVDFPSFREDREVLLCWVRGEDGIQFWHGTDEGYPSRKPL